MKSKNMFNQTPPVIEVDETFITVRREDRRIQKTLTLNKRRKEHRRSNEDIFKK